jgi:hypothetical protein
MALTCALGGPNGSKMLDECAEARPVDHRNLKHKEWGRYNTTNEMRWNANVCGQAGRAKCALPALWERQHDWLQETNGRWHGNVLVAARYRDRNDGQLAIVASNWGSRDRPARRPLALATVSPTPCTAANCRRPRRGRRTARRRPAARRAQARWRCC